MADESFKNIAKELRSTLLDVYNDLHNRIITQEKERKQIEEKNNEELHKNELKRIDRELKEKHQAIENYRKALMDEIKETSDFRSSEDFKNSVKKLQLLQDENERVLEMLEDQRAEIVENKKITSEEQKKALDSIDKQIEDTKKLNLITSVRQKNSLDYQKAYESAERKHLSYAEKQAEKRKKLHEDTLRKEAEVEKLISEGASEEDISNAKKEARRAEEKEAQNELVESLKKSLVSALDKLTNAVDSNLTSLAGYQAGMMARLQGSTSNYDDMVNLVRRNLRGSPLVKQKDVLDNLQKLTEKGIAYDLEQRAFLATVRDKIATTFDAFDSTLLRLIRLQQADTTAARLGMEANLTRMLNTMFSDTSYLSDVYDTVSSAILDANSQMSREGSLAFEYTVQKWLGALYSLGLSQNAISSIAEGINYLGTGNASALAGNDALQTLFAMSASKGGLPYTDLIIDGLDSSETNKLLRGMVEYLREIAEGADNLVVKSAYSQILGLSVADFAALQNLTEGEIEAIAGTNVDYSGAMSELTYQLGQLSYRIPLGERIKNVFDNAMFSVASSVFESAPLYATYLITDAIEQVTGGIPLPAVYAFGTGLDLTAFTIEGIVKDAIVGLNLLSQLPFIFGNMMSGSGVDLSSWGGMPSYNTRGDEFIIIQNGVTRKISSSTYVGSGSSSDIKSSSISSAAEEGDVVKSASGQEDTEYVKAAPSLEGDAAGDWKKWIGFLNENPIPVTVASFGSKPIDVNIVLGGTGELDSSYTMLDMVKRVVEGFNESDNSFKISTDSSTDPLVFKNKVDAAFIGNPWGY